MRISKLESAVLSVLLCLYAGGCASNDEAGTGGSSQTSSAATAATADSASSSGTATASVSASSTATSASVSTGTGTMCGDGAIEGSEACDGTNFGGKTCQSFGLSDGTLVCNDSCGVVLLGCGPGEACGNAVDDDQDGLIDCDDPDCASAARCTDSCLSPIFVAVPSSTPSDNTGFPSLLAPSCTPGAGRDVVFQFVAPATENILVNVTFPAFDAEISIRTTCDDETSEVACENHAVNGNEQILLSAIQGQAYYAVVQSVSGGTGFFQLELDEIFPESGCDDFIDDDFDGYVDCDDPDACQGTPLCTPGSGPVGSPCTDNPDCAATNGDPVCLQEFFFGFSNGYCSEFCDVASNDCPGDAQCVQLGVSHDGVCMDGCVTAADCRPGYACIDHGLPEKVCDRPPEAACNDNKDNDKDGLVDCEDPSSCQTSPACTSGPGAVGTPCQLHNQCHANQNDPFCIDQFDFNWPAGYCSEFCDIAADDCPSGSACSSWVPFMSGNGLCFVTCGNTTDCPLGYTCQSDGTHMICVN